MCNCCIFTVLFNTILFIIKKGLGVDLKSLFTSKSKGVCSVRLKSCRFLFEDLSLANRPWNDILLRNNVPLRFSYGDIGSIEICIGWFLFGKITIHIKGTSLLFITTNERYYDSTLEAKKMIENKRFLIKALESLYSHPVYLNEYKSQGRGISGIILRTALLLYRKIQIEVEDIHVRVEEMNTVSDERTSFGVITKKITLSEDKILRKTIADTRFSSTKKLDIASFSFYWNPDETHMISILNEEEEILERLRIHSYNRVLGHSYVIYPCSPSLCVTTQPGKDEMIKTDIKSEMQSVVVNVSKDQLKVATSLLGHIKHLQNTMNFIKYRPSSSVIDHPRHWWIYAFNCIGLIRSSSKWDWLEIREESELKQRYSELYHKLLVKKGSSKAIKKQLQTLEDEMSVLGTLTTRRKVERELEPGLLRSIRKKHSRVSRGINESWHSLSGQCNFDNIELTLSSDYTTQTDEIEEIKIFTVKIFGSYFESTMGHHKSSVILRVRDVVCSGIGHNDHNTNVIILTCDKTSAKGDGVLSLKLTWLNSDDVNEGNATTQSQYTYFISTYLRPTILNFDWITLHRLAEFVAVVRGSHKDFHDAIKARVKEVSRASRVKFKTFITNKERASLDANITLPLIVFDTSNSFFYHQLNCQFGQLNVQTVDLQDEPDIGANCVGYKVVLKNARIWLCSDMITFDAIDDVSEGKCCELFRFAPVTSDVKYTTFNDSYIPSNLQTTIHCPKVYLGITEGQFESVLQYCYNQLEYVIDSMKIVNSGSVKTNKSEILLSTSSSRSLQFNNEQAEIEQLLTDEEADFRPMEDYLMFECATDISSIIVCLKELSPGPHVLLTFNDIFVLYKLKEQSTDVSVKLSCLELSDRTHKDRSDQPIRIISTEHNFVNFNACFADSEASLFPSHYKSIESLYDIELTPLSIALHYEFLDNILNWISELKIPPFISLLDTLKHDQDETDNNSENTEKSGQQAINPPSKDAVNSLCNISIHQIEISLTTSRFSSLLTGTIQNIVLTYCDKYNDGSLDFSVECFNMTDDLIPDESSYRLVVSSTKDAAPFLKTITSYKYNEDGLIFTKCDVDINSFKIIYLHKLIKSIQVLMTNIFQKYKNVKTKCYSKLTQAKTVSRRTSVKAKSRARHKYQITVNIDKCSLKLPRDTYHPDTLTLKGKCLNLVYSNEDETYNSEDADEIDSPILHDQLLKAVAQYIELNWNFGKMQSTVATTNNFSISKDSSCWIIQFTFIKVHLTGENLASVPNLIGSNFSEKDQYMTAIMEQYSNKTQPNEPNQPKFVKQRRFGVDVNKESFDPFIKLIITELDCVIRSSVGIKDVTMACLGLTNTCITVGSICVAKTNYDLDKGVAVKISVDDVTGVEGMDIDCRQKILTKYGEAKSMYCSPVLEINVQSLSSGKNEVTIGFNDMCLSLWPTFLHSLIKFKNQIKVKQGKRYKWQKMRRRSVFYPDENSMSTTTIVNPATSSDSGSQVFVIKIGLEKCSIAFLENCNNLEITTPGTMIEFQTTELGNTKEVGVYQLVYRYTSPRYWSFDISSCWLHGNLCVFGETLLPLTNVFPPFALSLNYNVNKRHQKLVVDIPTLECHITNELHQVIGHFYGTFVKENLSDSVELRSSILSDDIWSIKDFNRASVLPDLPDELCFDEIDGDDDLSSSDEEYDNFEVCYLEDQQEAYIDINDITINFDLMSSGDNNSVPVICLHSCVKCVVSQWSKQLNVNVDLTLQSFIYNERRAIWEPFLEPVNTADNGYRPYALNIKLLQMFDLLPGIGPDSVLQTITASHSSTSISTDRDSCTSSLDSPQSIKSNRFKQHKSLSITSDQMSLPPSPYPVQRFRDRHSSHGTVKSTAKHSSPKASRRQTVVSTCDSVSVKSTDESKNNSTYILLIVSNDRLEVTLTPSALNTIQTYTKVLEVDYQKAMENIRNSVQDSRPPVRIENKTGVAVTVFPGPTFNGGDIAFSAPFLFHARTLRHFPSIVARHLSDEQIDGGQLEHRTSQQSACSLPNGSEHSIQSTWTPGLVKIRNSKCILPTSSEESIPFFFKPLDECPIDGYMVNSESFCEDIDEEEDKVDTLTLDAATIPVVEWSMNEISENDAIDDTTDVEDCDNGKILDKRQKRKSVCFLQVMQDKSTNNVNDSQDYWKPKLLRKTHQIKLEIQNSSKSLAVPVALPGVFAVPVNHHEYGKVALICEVSFKKGVRKVLLKSGLQIQNNLPFQMVAYTFHKSSDDIVKLGELDGNGSQLFEVPFHEVADKNISLKFGIGSGGVPCTETIHWKSLCAQENRSQIIACPQGTQYGSQYFIRASIKLIPAAHLTLHSPSHIIILESSLILQNHLPFPVDIVLENVNKTIPSQLFNLEECKSELIYDLPPKDNYTLRFSFEYSELFWSGECSVCFGSTFTKMVKLYALDKRNRKIGKKMYINLLAMVDSPHIINIYSPYWVVNKTNIDLEFEYQPSKHRIQAISSKTDRLPLLLTYKSGRVDEQHKVRLRVYTGDWCKPFVLGAVGKIVNVMSVCKKRSYPFEFAIETRLLDSTLSEIVYIMPKYSILNSTNVNLVCTPVASNGDLLYNNSVLLHPAHNTSLEAFWPGRHELIDLCLSDEEQSHLKHYKFSLSILSPTVIKTEYKELPVVTVRVQPDPLRGTTVVGIRPMVNVGAIVKIQNLCRWNCIRFMQGLTSGSGQLYPLEPNQSILYTWDCPVGKREINWQVDGAMDGSWKEIKLDKPKQSGKERLNARKLDKSYVESVTIFWESMFEESQLVLNFFDNEDDYKHFKKLRTQIYPDSVQFFCSLEGIGVSLVDNTPKEVAYFTIMSSPILWTKKRSKTNAIWTMINKQQSEQLEMALSTEQSSIVIDNEEYDLENMEIKSQRGGEICRTYNPGIWVWYSQCDNHLSLNLRLGRLQIDNQLNNTELSTKVVFSEIESKEVEKAGSPFLDLDVSISMHGRNAIREYEKVLMNIQPCRLNIELGLIAALLPFADTSFAKDVHDENSELDQLDVTLYELLDAKNLLAIRTLNYIDGLQINHTAVNVTYTTAGDYDLSSEWGRVVNAIIHFALITRGSFNISLQSVQISNEITDPTQLKRILYGHYKNEIFWQFQHLALGLDVIGNPAKLFNSFQTGARDLVFKSREGISEGEVGYGIALGMKSLFGHVIGGGANSIELSTGSLSSMLLAATDLDYQREHRHMRQTQDTASITLAGKFFLKGLFRGATDIVVQPATGAVNQGIEGFLKGLGRGTVSILVKPTLGLVDLTKYTMESVRSAVDDEVEVQTVRRPRLLISDKEMSPYNSYEAEGLYILNHLSQPLSDQHYICHCWQPVIDQHTMVLMVTSKQLLQLYKTSRKYCIEWSVGLDKIDSVQATQYRDDSDTVSDEEKPGLLLNGTFTKSRNTVQQVVLRMECQTDVQNIKEKLKRAIKNCRKKKMGILE